MLGSSNKDYRVREVHDCGSRKKELVRIALLSKALIPSILPFHISELSGLLLGGWEIQ